MLRPGPSWPGGVRAAVSDRLDGVSRPPYDAGNLAGHVGDDPAAVARNRVAVAADLGVDPAAVVWMEQVHGAAVAVVDAVPTGPVPGVDVLVTARPGVVLAVLVADCLPVLLADPGAGVVAAVHCGRRGLAGGVLAAAVAAMGRLGATPAGTSGWVGPGVGGCCYEVPAEMRAAVLAVAPAAEVPGRGSLDLSAGAVGRLADLGVTDVSTAGGCTVEDARFFSYRRERVTGRFAGFVWRGR